MDMEMKLMDLAKLVYELPIGGVIDFANGNSEDVERCGGWCGIKRIEEFDNDNMMFLVGLYGGEANTRLYALSEYDERIGDFCEPRLTWCIGPEAENRRRDIDYVECIARMLADFIIDYEGSVNETITVYLEE